MSSANGSAKKLKRPSPAASSNRGACLGLQSLGIPRGSVTMGTPNGPDILKLSYVDMGTRQVPPAEAQLWRFMDLAKLVSILDRNALYFPVLASLNDELEGSPPRPPQGATDEDRLRAYDTWQYNRTVLFVNCWHQSDDESAAMWALYGNQGVAVRTTFGLLSKAVHQCPSANPPVPDLTLVGAMVDYLSPDKTSPPADVSNPIAHALRKLRWYEYEKEVPATDPRSHRVPHRRHASPWRGGTAAHQARRAGRGSGVSGRRQPGTPLLPPALE